MKHVNIIVIKLLLVKVVLKHDKLIRELDVVDIKKLLFTSYKIKALY